MHIVRAAMEEMICNCSQFRLFLSVGIFIFIVISWLLDGSWLLYAFIV